MPEQYHKRKWRLRPEFGLQAAGELGNLLRVHCWRCKRTRYFLPTDLAAHFGDREVDDFTLPCPTCGTSETVRVNLYTPNPGDYGSLEVRRPLPPVMVVKWKTVKLGDKPE